MDIVDTISSSIEAGSKTPPIVKKKLWEMLWREVLELGLQRATMSCYQGYLISGKDRQFDERFARERYLVSLSIVTEKGDKHNHYIPQEVIDSEPEFFADLERRRAKAANG